MSYDSESLRLAAHFLPGGSDDAKSALAQHIQSAVEDWMSHTVTVCSACRQASCWHGEFMCFDAKAAGTVEETQEELAKLGREHPSWWDKTTRLG